MKNFAICALSLMLAVTLGFSYTMQTKYMEIEDAYAEIIQVIADGEGVEQPSVVPEETIIGFKNNNPCNVKGKKWQGQIGSDKFGHAIFSHPVYSLRAAAIILKNYQKRHGLETLHEITQRYAEGNQAQYATFLSKRLGVGVNDKLDVLHHMPTLLKSIVRFETGEQPYPEEMFAPFGVFKSI